MYGSVSVKHAYLASSALIIIALLFDWPYTIIPGALGIGLSYFMKRKAHQRNLKYLKKEINEVFESSERSK